MGSVGDRTIEKSQQKILLAFSYCI